MQSAYKKLRSKENIFYIEFIFILVHKISTKWSDVDILLMV